MNDVSDNQNADQNTKSQIAKREEEILAFWQENKIFEKSLEKNKAGNWLFGKKEFVFYEGPPTANGKPGIHHLEARAFKDAIPRYKTMQGFYVRRKGGWDTHGLPVELQVEKQLGLKSKKEIEEYGIAAFNKKCKESVWEYKDIWEKFTKRIGYWIDLENPYITYDNSYIESVWNILKEVDKKNLLYKDYKVVPWCPRCGTALSSHELAQGYETVKDLSITVEFKLKDSPNTSVLAWTTTPWTLPGNVALAVGQNIDYVEIEKKDEGVGDLVRFILAKDRLESVFGSDEYKIIKEMKGKDLVGLNYEPLYDFLKNNFEQEGQESFQKAYKVYAADFVNTEDGTGIVHTAVMYGQDDFVLGTKIGLPKYHLVDESGHFISGTDFLEGKFVKDEETTVEIIKDLAHRNLLFKKEKYEHSYPHCWRCKTALIYYARDSWYIKMSSLREELVEQNKNINWEPSHIKEGRFGEWLREIKDWAISRERYWGTPLPVWQNERGEPLVVGSIDELKKYTKKSGNKYFVMRHGEAKSNITGISDREGDPENHLTDKGKEEILESCKELKKEKIDIIISSPFLRTRETVDVLKKELGVGKIIFDERICEIKPNENNIEVRKRMGDFIFDIESKYKDKNIIIVSHGFPIWILFEIAGLHALDLNKVSYDQKTAEVKELAFFSFPHNEDYELDLHKPYIDDVELLGDNGEKLTRVKEVMDVWFDSGAMPFAQDHFLQGGRDKILYPADYISEAIDQTRGWFYTLHAIGVLMGKGNAYKNVICLGHILDSEGKKMSKSLGNIVDPWLMTDKYGVDTLRFWMYSVNSPGDSKNFDERSVDEIVKKAWNPLTNILSFYKMYASKDIEAHRNSNKVLDRWILAQLDELVTSGTKSLENFDLFSAVRPIKDFVNDFSTWYIRRSRDRFKSDDLEDKKNALSTTAFVLKELSKYMAPFTPFFAEALYQDLKTEEEPMSVHLCDWPKQKKVDVDVLDRMSEVRRVVSQALENRNDVGIKVRQPLSQLKVKSEKLKGGDEYINLIKDEVNVKEVEFVQGLDNEVELDTEITPELQKEGYKREFIRAIQELRKQKGLEPTDRAVLIVKTDKDGEEFLNGVIEDIKKPTNIVEIKFEDGIGGEVVVGGLSFSISLNRNT